MELIMCDKDMPVSLTFNEKEIENIFKSAVYNAGFRDCDILSIDYDIVPPYYPGSPHDSRIQAGLKNVKVRFLLK